MKEELRVAICEWNGSWADVRDVSDLVVGSVKWSGKTGSAARQLDISFLDAGGKDFQSAVSDIKETRNTIYLYLNGVEVFRGIVMKTSRSDKKTLSVKAYDYGVYLANNKSTFVYANNSPAEIFADVCSRVGLPYRTENDSWYRIPELTCSKKTAWDAIAEMLELTHDATGVRWNVSFDGDTAVLYERRNYVTAWVIEPERNLTGYSYSASIEKTRTRYTLYTKEDQAIAVAVNSELENKIGVFADCGSADSDLNEAQLNEQVYAKLSELSAVEQSLSVDCRGIAEITAGTGVAVYIPELKMKNLYYVDSDTHTFANGEHSMKLSLTIAQDIKIEPPPVQQEVQTFGATIGEGMIVNFLGGSHYVSSDAGSPTGQPRAAGTAKVTKIASGAAHPYHLIGGVYDSSVGGSSNVYGWVDAGTVQPL